MFASSRRNEKVQRLHTIHQQLESASLFLFSDLIAQDHCIVPLIHLSDPMNGESIPFLFYSIVLLQCLTIF